MTDHPITLLTTIESASEEEIIVSELTVSADPLARREAGDGSLRLRNVCQRNHNLGFANQHGALIDAARDLPLPQQGEDRGNREAQKKTGDPARTTRNFPHNLVVLRQNS